MLYLYVKEHNVTGLKYLGYTSRDDYHSYPGSGVHWKRHLNAHGYNYTTTVLLASVSKRDIKETGKFFSDLYNVVESTSWANLKPEEGAGGSHVVSEEQKQKQSNWMKGRYVGNKNPMYGKKRNDLSERNKLPKRWVTNGMEDKLVLKTDVDRYLSEGYCIGRSQNNNKGKKIKQSTVRCEICAKDIRSSNYARHFKKCQTTQVQSNVNR